MSYAPQPIETEAVTLTPELLALTERLAEHVHDLWSRQRLADGWRYGPRRDDAKKEHPGLVPYAALSELEKEYDRLTALETLKAMVALGYQVVKGYAALAHDVFISYSTKDKAVADAVCPTLEASEAVLDRAPRCPSRRRLGTGDHRCHLPVPSCPFWCSPRVGPTDAVKREAERAFCKGIVIVPFRIEDIQPAGGWSLPQHDALAGRHDQAAEGAPGPAVRHGRRDPGPAGIPAPVPPRSFEWGRCAGVGGGGAGHSRDAYAAARRGPGIPPDAPHGRGARLIPPGPAARSCGPSPATRDRCFPSPFLPTAKILASAGGTQEAPTASLNFFADPVTGRLLRAASPPGTSVPPRRLLLRRQDFPASGGQGRAGGPAGPLGRAERAETPDARRAAGYGLHRGLFPRRQPAGERGEDGAVTLWDVPSGRQQDCSRAIRTTLIRWPSPPIARALASGGEAQSGDASSVEIWDPADEKQTGTLTGHTNAVYSVAFRRTAGRLPAEAPTLPSGSGTWRPGGKSVCSAVMRVQSCPWRSRRTAERLASGGGDGVVRLWDVATGQPLSTLTGHTGHVFSVAFSPDRANAGERRPGRHDQVVEISAR